MSEEDEETKEPEEELSPEGIRSCSFIESVKVSETRRRRSKRARKCDVVEVDSYNLDTVARERTSFTM